MWPNEYDKLVKDKKNKDKDNRRDDRERDRKRGRDRDRHRHDSPPVKFSGMGSRISEEDSYTRSPPARDIRGSGAAIAPPPSLQQESNTGNDR